MRTFPLTFYVTKPGFAWKAREQASTRIIVVTVYYVVFYGTAKISRSYFGFYCFFSVVYCSPIE